MNRRQALKATTALVGGVMVTSTGIFAACRPGARQERPDALTPEDQALIEEVADTLLPTTPSSPGAKAAGAGATINLLLTDCYEPEAQRRVVEGLANIRKRGFTSRGRREREQLLREIDVEAQQAGKTHYFALVRELALDAYFSSEVGLTQALRYRLTPGRWVGCIPLEPGQPAWG
jgi:hypothetical protein